MTGGVDAAARGALVLGIVGCWVGLVLGLCFYPPTAWAAVIEIRAPSAVVGGLMGAALAAARRFIR